MIDTQAIRSKILDLAMRGKLTEQLPEDGTAEELYQQIQAEKQALIKAGKIKKEKPLPEFSEEEKPFPIPISWRWVYLGELFQHNTGKALNSSDTQGQQLEYITTSNLYWNRFELDSLKTMPFTDNELEKCTVKKGDLLVCEGGDIGRSAVWPYDYDMRIQNHIHRLRRYSANICTEFYYYLLWLYKQTGRIDGIGIGLQGFSSNRVHSLIVPFAPYNEAVRVVEIIEQAFSILDTIDALQAQYADNLTVLKSKLIDAAIQGKLTEQLPEDGTAEELYQQIQAEKQALIKAGKIKKEKPLPEISADEIPHAIPENWKWCRVGMVSSQITDGEHKTPRRVSSFCGYYLLSARNVTNNSIKLDDVDYIDEEEYNILSKRCNPKRNDVLISCSGSIGRCCVVEDDNKYVMVRSAAMVSLIKVHPKWIMYCIHSNALQKQISDKAKATAQANLFQDPIKRLIIPIPPIAEQKRIVDRLDGLLAVCNSLK